MRKFFNIAIPAGRIFGLDILRALAILFVAGRHSSYLLPKPLYEFANLFIFDGVSIFFVLSGYLIGGILVRTLENGQSSGADLLHFWKRRWWRTLPNYFLILVLLCVIHVVFSPAFSVKTIASYFIFSQNIASKHPWFFPEAWSLSIEEWFYLLVPALLFSFVALFKIRPRCSFLTSIIVIILLVTLVRYFRFKTLGIADIENWDLIFRKQVVSRLDSLMFGVLGACIKFYYPSWWLKLPKAWLLLGISLFLFLKFAAVRMFPALGLYDCVFSFTIVSVATLCLLPFLSELKNGHGFIYRLITRTSLISYAMYLINLSLIKFWIIDQVNWVALFPNGYLLVASKFLLFWLLTIAGSVIIYKYFELPMTNRRDRRT
jgi:peptidoglycan/LPS O-acetylase OafA/YrhL